MASSIKLHIVLQYGTHFRSIPESQHHFCAHFPDSTRYTTYTSAHPKPTSSHSPNKVSTTWFPVLHIEIAGLLTVHDEELTLRSYCICLIRREFRRPGSPTSHIKRDTTRCLPPEDEGIRSMLENLGLEEGCQRSRDEKSMSRCKCLAALHDGAATSIAASSPLARMRNAQRIEKIWSQKSDICLTRLLGLQMVIEIRRRRCHCD